MLSNYIYLSQAINKSEPEFSLEDAEEKYISAGQRLTSWFELIKPLVEFKWEVS
jgi:hypothetical protein